MSRSGKQLKSRKKWIYSVIDQHGGFYERAGSYLEEFLKDNIKATNFSLEFKRHWFLSNAEYSLLNQYTTALAWNLENCSGDNRT